MSESVEYVDIKVGPIVTGPPTISVVVEAYDPPDQKPKPPSRFKLILSITASYLMKVIIRVLVKKVIEAAIEGFFRKSIPIPKTGSQIETVSYSHSRIP